MKLLRWRYWKQENQFSGRVPGGMSEAADGEYVKFEDVQGDLINSRIHNEFTTQAALLGYTSTEQILNALAKFREAALPTKVFEIWREGYAATGDHGTAQLMAKVRGILFKDAVKAYYDGMTEEERKPFNLEQMTYWGCRLFDNETEARKSFG